MRAGIGLLSVIVVLHHTVALVHGGAHNDLDISMALWQRVFIDLIIVALPLAGICLLWTKYERVGLYAVLFGMLAALVFGIMHHYMLVSPDHISHLPHGDRGIQATFQWTAGAIAMLEAVAAAVAAYFVGRERPVASA